MQSQINNQSVSNKAEVSPQKLAQENDYLKQELMKLQQALIQINTPNKNTRGLIIPEDEQVSSQAKGVLSVSPLVRLNKQSQGCHEANVEAISRNKESFVDVAEGSGHLALKYQTLLNEFDDIEDPAPLEQSLVDLPTPSESPVKVSRMEVAVNSAFASPNTKRAKQDNSNIESAMMALQQSWQDGPCLNLLNQSEIILPTPLEESKDEDGNFTLNLIKIESPEKPHTKSVRRSKAQRNNEASGQKLSSKRTSPVKVEQVQVMPPKTLNYVNLADPESLQQEDRKTEQLLLALDKKRNERQKAIRRAEEMLKDFMPKPSLLSQHQKASEMLHQSVDVAPQPKSQSRPPVKLNIVSKIPQMSSNSSQIMKPVKLSQSTSVDYSYRSTSVSTTQKKLATHSRLAKPTQVSKDYGQVQRPSSRITDRSAYLNPASRAVQANKFLQSSSKMSMCSSTSSFITGKCDSVSRQTDTISRATSRDTKSTLSIHQERKKVIEEERQLQRKQKLDAKLMKIDQILGKVEVPQHQITTPVLQTKQQVLKKPVHIRTNSTQVKSGLQTPKKNSGSIVTNNLSEKKYAFGSTMLTSSSSKNLKLAGPSQEPITPSRWEKCLRDNFASLGNSGEKGLLKAHKQNNQLQKLSIAESNKSSGIKNVSQSLNKSGSALHLNHSKEYGVAGKVVEKRLADMKRQFRL